MFVLASEDRAGCGAWGEPGAPWASLPFTYLPSQLLSLPCAGAIHLSLFQAFTLRIHSLVTVHWNKYCFQVVFKSSQPVSYSTKIMNILNLNDVYMFTLFNNVKNWTRLFYCNIFPLFVFVLFFFTIFQ